MPPGKYPHHVVIEGPTSKQNQIGEWITEFGKVGEAYASIEPLRGREYWAAAQMQSEVTHEVRMRPPGITVTSSHEIVFGVRRFGIESVRNVKEERYRRYSETRAQTGERGYELAILCKEKS